MPSWRAHSRVATTHRKLCAMPSAARASRQAGSGSRSRCRSGTRSPDRRSGLRSCAPVTGPLDGLIAGRICDVRHSAWWGSSGCCEGGGGGVDGGPFGAVAGPSGDGLVIGGEPVDGLVVDGEVGASLADGCPVHGRSRGRRPHRAHGGRHRVRRRPRPDAGWVHVTPRTDHTSQGTPTCCRHNDFRNSPADHHRSPLVGVQLVRPRPLVPRGLRALQLDLSSCWQRSRLPRTGSRRSGSGSAR